MFLELIYLSYHGTQPWHKYAMGHINQKSNVDASLFYMLA